MDDTAVQSGRFALRARQILSHDADPAQPGRPLRVMIGGGAVMGLCLVLGLLLAYRTWYLEQLSPDNTYYGLSFLFAIYTGGAFLFSLGYELFDTARALRLTLIIAALTLVAVGLVIAVFAALAKAKAGANALRGLTDAGDEVADSGLLGSVLSYGEDGASSRRRDGNDLEPIPTPETFTIGCPSCGNRFNPAPPRAICPACGEASLP